MIKHSSLTNKSPSIKHVFYIEANITGFITNFEWYYIDSNNCNKMFHPKATNKESQKCTKKIRFQGERWNGTYMCYEFDVLTI